MSTRCNRKPSGRCEGTKQMISSFLKSFNVNSGVERTADSENTNAHRTNHDVRFMPLPLVTLPVRPTQLLCRASDLAAPLSLCKDHNMKHFLLACLFPALLTAQNMQLTEQLGKTVLCDDIALSPDGAHVAWVQSTAATTSKQTHIRGTSGNAAFVLYNLATNGERKDSDPAWSPDSKKLAFFSNAGEKDQAQLWAVNSDGSDPKKITHLKGYAARPRWSHDGKRIAFLYIEGAGGGGPLM